MLEMSPVATLSAVRLVKQHSRSVHLQLWQRQRESTMLALARRMATNAIESLFWAVQQVDTLDNVTELELKCAELDTLLPPSVTTACPNLTKLSLSGCNVVWSSATSFTARLPKLRELCFNCTRIAGITDLQQPQLSQQLASLTALQKVEVGFCQPENPAAEYGAYAKILPMLPYQNVYGSCNTCATVMRELDWLQQWAALKFLELLDIHDADMQQLLQLPSLARLTCHRFTLESSYVGHTCRWQEVEAGSVSVEALARLPLHPNLHLKAFVLSALPSSVGLLRQAASNMRRCTMLWQTKESGLDIQLQFQDRAMEDAVMEQLFVEALPLFNHAEHVGLYIKLTDTVINRFSVYAQARGPFTLSLCSDIRGANVIGLMSALTAGSTLQIQQVISEAQLTQLCCAAQRPITFEKGCFDEWQGKNFAEGFVKRIQLAMQQCGHQHVTLLY